MLKRCRLRLFLLCFILLSGTSVISVDAQVINSADAALIIEHLQELIISSGSPDSGRVQDLLHSMRPDGSWENIDYKSVRISHWQALSHLACVLSMVKNYVDKRSSFYKNGKLNSAIHRSLDFWLDHNFTSQNWWYNDIGVPNTLTDVLILFDNDMTKEELLSALNQMRGSYIDQTGQNRVWRAEIQLKIGLLEYGKGGTNLLGSPPERIQKSIDILKQEVVVRAQEGIQPDWSFHQHGVQQQFGNYGLAFASTQAEWAWILKGTAFQYDKEKMAILRNYILKGLSRVVWKGSMDISGAGRQLFPNSLISKGESVLRVLQLMVRADPAHASAYNQVIAFNKGESPNPVFLKGNTNFWRSDLMVDRSDRGYMSVRMCSKKIQSTESGNGENMLGNHLSDGATFIYQTGREYQDIFPVWNWHRIPGVTSYVQTKLLPLSWGGLHNGSNSVGGVSDSTCGIASMLFNRDGLTAHKSWFFGPRGLVCLGAGIHSSKNTNVSTTVNQCLLAGNVMVQTNRRELTMSRGHQLDSRRIEWVRHDHVGYVFLQNEKVHVSADNQQGDWARVFLRGSKKQVSRKVFNLWIDHGDQPHDQSYAYLILPDISTKLLASFIRHPSLKILQNDTTLQAVQYPATNLTQAVFYQAGEISLNKNTILQTNAACMLMVRQFKGKLKLTVAVPPELGKKIILSLNGHYTGRNCSYDPGKDQTEVIFNLPDGIYAGQSVTGLLTLL
jgi:chondroitin AC lyase